MSRMGTRGMGVCDVRIGDTGWDAKRRLGLGNRVESSEIERGFCLMD